MVLVERFTCRSRAVKIPLSAIGLMFIKETTNLLFADGFFGA